MPDLAMLNELGLTRAPQTPSQSSDISSGALQQEAFLELMIAQFQNQDPFKPMENGDFLGQLAQFGTVSGIEDLQQSFSSFADSLYSDQALQASSLIGREVLIPGSRSALGVTGGVRGATELPTSTPSMVVQVKDASGALIRRLDLGVQDAGLTYFEWDGLNQAGQRMPPGAYEIEVVAGPDGMREQMPVFMEARVDSVTLGNIGGVLLNLEQLGEIPLADVRRIGGSAG
ncbi:MAG: flagellar hook assembly protein FlgD [Pseudomonadota bacterium]